MDQHFNLDLVRQVAVAANRQPCTKCAPVNSMPDRVSRARSSRSIATHSRARVSGCVVGSVVGGCQIVMDNIRVRFVHYGN